ncbi:hypothetical protein ACFOVU_26605 [Nocardiopsis sediminis]|uniref:DUF8017 domain-containing protein n=1 Tax=Nocardiopsis sediminis TaxID=1778267 RepID=A0ABV8FUE5_9ACTN
MTPSEPSPNGRAGGRGMAMAVGTLIGALSVAIIVLVAIYLRDVDLFTGSDEAAGADAAASASPSADASPVPVTTPTADDPEALVEAATAGWKGVAVEERGVAYDIPDDWFAHAPDLTVGFEEEDPDAPFGYSPRVAMSGAAEYGAREEPCYDYPPAPAMSGTSGAGEVVDTAEMSMFLAGEWAEAGYGNDSGEPEVEVGETAEFAANGLEGHRTTATVQVAEHPCYPAQAQATVFAFLAPSGDDVYTLVVYSDTSGDQATSSETVDGIMSSLRPL